VIAALGVAVPWIGGYLVTALLGYPTATALFVGTALTATSIAITANVLKELGHLDTPVARAIIGAAVIDDVLSLLVLGLTTDAIQGSFSVPSLGVSLVSAVLFIGLGLVIGMKLVSPMLSRLDRTPLARQYPEFVFIAALAIAFLNAMVAEAIGLSGIVGAFIAGSRVRRSPSAPARTRARGPSTSGSSSPRSSSSRSGSSSTCTRSHLQSGCSWSRSRWSRS
jgi:Kef-type K+ transport system membrane component KefB